MRSVREPMTVLEALVALVAVLFPWLLAGAVVVVLFGCGPDPSRPVVVTKPVEVPIPVPVMVSPPPELLEPVYDPDRLPEFVSPSDPMASSALTGEGERRLRELLLDLLDRLEAWSQWAR